MPPVCVVISTHTPRHLKRTLLGLACQSRRADVVVVSCDNEDSEIGEVVRGCAGEMERGCTLVQRAYAGVARLNQVRNNGLRAVAAGAGGRDDPVVVMLDGDCVLGRSVLAYHEGACRRGRLVLGYRIDLTPEQTEGFDEGALPAGREPVVVTGEQRRMLRARQRRYQRQAGLKPFGLTKPHKPKPLGAHMAFRLSDCVAVNGFDERYEGYGQDDDDFGRRMYAAGVKPVVALERALALHLYHPTRAPRDWHGSPNAALFAEGGPVRCVQGIDSPGPQAAVRVDRFA